MQVFWPVLFSFTNLKHSVHKCYICLSWTELVFPQVDRALTSVRSLRASSMSHGTRGRQDSPQPTAHSFHLSRSGDRFCATNSPRQRQSPAALWSPQRPANPGSPATIRKLSPRVLRFFSEKKRYDPERKNCCHHWSSSKSGIWRMCLEHTKAAGSVCISAIFISSLVLLDHESSVMIY